MPAVQDQRPRYYEGQYLGASDLTAAVTHARVHEARHLLGAHTWGIAAGLELQEIAPPDGGDAVKLFVLPGYAWDGFGRSMVVHAPYPVPTDLFQSYLYAAGNNATLSVWICAFLLTALAARPRTSS